MTEVDPRKPLPFKASSQDELTCTQKLHLCTVKQRVAFVNDLFRVLKPGGKCQIVTPHWCASRAYGDILHVQWPPVAEAWYPFLNAGWRKANFPKERTYKCDFDLTTSYGVHPALTTRHQEYTQEALGWYREAAQDLVVMLIKRG